MEIKKALIDLTVLSAFLEKEMKLKLHFLNYSRFFIEIQGGFNMGISFYTYSHGLRNKKLKFIRVEKTNQISTFELDGYYEFKVIIEPYKKLQRKVFRIPNKLYKLSENEVLNAFNKSPEVFARLI